jgi:uncharacterized protein (TIGR03083 family)
MDPAGRGINARRVAKGEDSTMNRALRPVGPVHLAGRFAPLDAELIALLRGLRPDDWRRPTACARWSVKDIAAHLLDGNVRRLSFQRDGLSAVPEVPVENYSDLVNYLNRLNAEWVTAARRISPALLIDLLEYTGRQLTELFAGLDPQGPAIFPVAWAGEAQSANWFDLGREYTERWLHQQQIRDAVGAPGLTSREWLHPVLDLFLRALPFRYREVTAPPGTELHLEIEGPAGGDWTLKREAEGWELYSGASRSPAACVRMDQHTAWRLFSKGLAPTEARELVTVEGDHALGEGVRGALAIMA